MTHKICTRCKKEVPINEMPRRTNGMPRGQCRPCRSKYEKNLRIANAEKTRALVLSYLREYGPLTTDKMRAMARERGASMTTHSAIQRAVAMLVKKKAIQSPCKSWYCLPGTKVEKPVAVEDQNAPDKKMIDDEMDEWWKNLCAEVAARKPELIADRNY